MWAIVLIDSVLGLELARFGVRPRTLEGLLGLLTMPLLHSGVDHVLANTLPIAVLGTALLWVYPRTAAGVLFWSWVGPPLFVWLIGGSHSVHVGASGLTFALLSYLGLGGLLRLEAKSLAVSLLVIFYYGGMLTGILPITPGVSWQGHLGGLLVGIALAMKFRRHDMPARKRYDWEYEE